MSTRTVVSSEEFSKLDHHLRTLTYKWARRSHPNKSDPRRLLGQATTTTPTAAGPCQPAPPQGASRRLPHLRWTVAARRPSSPRPPRVGAMAQGHPQSGPQTSDHRPAGAWQRQRSRHDPSHSGLRPLPTKPSAVKAAHSALRAPRRSNAPGATRPRAAGPARTCRYMKGTFLCMRSGVIEGDLIADAHHHRQRPFLPRSIGLPSVASQRKGGSHGDQA